MTGLFVVLTALSAIPLAVFATFFACAAGDVSGVKSVRLFFISLGFQFVLVVDCIVLGYLAARW